MFVLLISHLSMQRLTAEDQKYQLKADHVDDNYADKRPQPKQQFTTGLCAHILPNLQTQTTLKQYYLVLKEDTYLVGGNSINRC